MTQSRILQSLPAGAVLALGLSLAAPCGIAAASAQEVVQPVPPPEVGELNAALQRLSRNAQDVDALIDAGNASLALDDVDAAVGFFGRAEELSPQNSRVMVGLARSAVRVRDPLRAIGLFNAAEEAGGDMASVALDRGLAYDLVGDNSSAQAEYRKGLAAGEDAELRRRLALSLAIAGDRAGFDETLNPLVARGDSASYRARAFGLSILGEEDEAVAIASAVMPSAMAARMEPYLRYMKRLTPAQQAGAANLGVFPRAAQIGRDAPEVARYREQNGLVRTADARLAPQGEPLGQRPTASTPRRRPDRGMSVAAAPEPSPEPATEVVDADALPESVRREVARAERQARADPLNRSRARPVVVVRRADSAPDGAAAQTQDAGAASPQAVATEQAVAVQPEPQTVRVVELAPAERGSSAAAAEPVGVAVRELPATSAPESMETIEPAPSTAAQLAEVAGSEPIVAPGFDLAQLDGGAQPAPASSAAEVEESAVEAASVAEAFAAFADAAPATAAVGTGGVDITRIDPPREVEKPVAPPTAKPAHPSRLWVQVATGRDVKALGFDWRRFSRQAPEVLGDLKPHVTPWGEANRLLAGPYKNRDEARKAMNLLKEKGVDSFVYTSPEGQEIDLIG